MTRLLQGQFLILVTLLSCLDVRSLLCPTPA